jgi:hypothetical protein
VARVRNARGGTIAVEGLDELVRDFRRMSPALAKGVREELKAVAGIVEEEARDVAEAKGLRDSGRLIRGTRRFAKASSAGVRNYARRKGFAYPMVYEYGGRGGGRSGPRAFLEPALDNKEEAVIEALDDMLGRLGTEHGF